MDNKKITKEWLEQEIESGGTVCVPVFYTLPDGTQDFMYIQLNVEDLKQELRNIPDGAQFDSEQQLDWGHIFIEKREWMPGHRGERNKMIYWKFHYNMFWANWYIDQASKVRANTELWGTYIAKSMHYAKKALESVG